MKFFLSFFIKKIKINSNRVYHFPGMTLTISVNDMEFSFFIGFVEIKNWQNIDFKNLYKNLSFGSTLNMTIDSFFTKVSSIIEHEKKLTSKKIQNEYYDAAIILFLNFFLFILLIYFLINSLKKLYKIALYIYIRVNNFYKNNKNK